MPKTRGELGTSNLQTQNVCLLLKMLHKFLNHYDILWVQLVWEADYKHGLPQAKLLVVFLL